MFFLVYNEMGSGWNCEENVMNGYLTNKGLF